MKYIIQCTSRIHGRIRYYSNLKYLTLTKFRENAMVYTDPEDFYELERILNDDWSALREYIFEPHVAQYHLTDLVKL